MCRIAARAPLRVPIGAQRAAKRRARARRAVHSDRGDCAMGGAGGCARRRKSARIRAAPRASGSPRPQGTSRGRGTAAPACGTCCPHPRRPQAPRGPTAPRRSGAAATRPSRGRALAAVRDPWPPTPPRRRTRHTQHPPELAAAGMAARYPRTIGPKPHLDAVADRIERVALGDAKLLRAPAALELEDQRPASEPQARERRAGSARQRREAPVLAPHRHDVEHRRHRPERRGRSVLGEGVLPSVEPEAPEPALGRRLAAKREGGVLEYRRLARARLECVLELGVSPQE